jgi:signal transduction histidine kinase
MGLGLLGARKLMDTFRVDSVPGQGTTVELGKALPPHAPEVTPQLVLRISAELARLAPTSPMDEIRQQNIALLHALDELQSRQLELDRMYREVAEANTQLEEKADALERIAALERAARAEAEAAVATREELLAIVSHDLRNPLGSIVFNAALLQRTTIDGEDGERVHKSGQTILRSADRMTRLIADLLDLAQIQAGKLAVEQTPQDAEGLIRDCVDMLRPLAASKDLRGMASAGLRVRCDRERVLQILSNLVGNAIKFTPDGGSIVIDAQDVGHEARFGARYRAWNPGRGIAANLRPLLAGPEEEPRRDWPGSQYREGARGGPARAPLRREHTRRRDDFLLHPPARGVRVEGDSARAVKKSALFKRRRRDDS